MNVKQAIELATANLSEISDSANLDARLLTSYACNIEQTQLITHPEVILNPEQEKKFTNYVKRRTKGEPLAYITGTKEFWSLDFIVNSHVLIPRPDTELLVELTLEAVSTLEKPRILELGTGSGAIAIAIAKERSDCIITATDLSISALEIAKKNAKRHNTEITFTQSNWYENLTTNQPNKNFNAIICNPPYISTDDPDVDLQVTLHEPHSALFSKNNGLQDLEIVISGANEYLLANGTLLVEHGFQQANHVRDNFSNANFSNICTHNDLAGRARCTMANQ